MILTLPKPRSSAGPLVLCLLLSGAASVAAAASVDPALPRYEPQPVSIPAGARYVQPDGSIFIAGAEEMTTGLKNLNDLYVRSHPGTRFSTAMAGSSVGPPAILFHVAAFAVVDRVLLPEELVPFDYMYHRPPVAIRVGRGSYSKSGYTPPIVVCVNPANPLEKLTTEQVARIFSIGGGSGDITTWGQVGLTGAWAKRTIQPIGMNKRSGEAVYMRVEKFGDCPFTARYEEMKSSEIGGRLAEEASAIAIVDRSFLPKAAKIVAVSETKDGYYSKASLEDVASGRYPYSSYTYFYYNPEAGKPIDPFVKEYLRMVLSREGQEAISNEPDGFLPLSAKEAAEERAKLQ